MSSWRPTAKAGWSVALVVMGCTGALASGRPEAVIVVVPLALVLVVGLSTAPHGTLEVEASPAEAAATQDEELEVQVAIGPAVAPWACWCRLEIGLALEPAFTPSAAHNGANSDRAAAFGLAQAQERTLRVVACHWGRGPVGRVVWRGSDILGLFQADGQRTLAREVTVYPRPEVLRHLLVPARAPTPAGTHLVRAKGAGVELAGVRPYALGDRARDINWRASARHGRDLFTNERHPERAGDVVLLIDTFDPGALDAAVVACAALARAFLARRDRVGLVKFGGWLRWLRPGGGPRHEWVILDVLLGTAAANNQLYRSASTLPPRALPPAALLIAVSSLEGAGSAEAITDMARRGLDVAVLQIEQTLPGPLTGGRDQPGADAVAVRLWRLARSQVELGLRQAGVPCASWRPGEPLAGPVDELVLWAARLRGAKH